MSGTNEVVRREVLSAFGATVGSVCLAGCSSSDSDTNPGETHTAETPQSEDISPKLVGFSRVVGFKILPQVTPENRDSTSVVDWKVEDKDGIQKVELYLENAENREEPIYRGKPEGDTAGMQTPFPQQMLAPGKNQFRLEVTDNDGNKESLKSEPVTFDIPGYRLDPQQDFGQYQTERTWDNTQFSQEHINQLRDKWQQKAIYDGFVEQVKAGNKFDQFGMPYPNWDEVEDEAGFFSLETFKSTDNWEKMLLYIVGATRDETFERYNGPPSGHANRMAASAEKAIEEVRGDDVRAWGVYNPGHGSMMFYTEDEEAEHRWYHADTTNNGLDEGVQRPEDALSHRPEIWSPFRSPDADQPGFHKGFDIDEVDGVNSYSQMKRVTLGSIQSMVASGRPIEFEGQYVFANEDWLDAAYDHIREGGKIDPILEPFEELVDHQVQGEDKYIGIYGAEGDSGLDDTRLAAGDDLGSVYDKVMEQPGNVSASQIEDMLEPGQNA